ncbi:MAG TPA: nicotinate-nucleotide adenylyltransferase [Symbiobacteriaceae bacterium]|nr:nicotinate-nucleotide adenylyltransferase [Symbiobacteriaceae bacterium]
MPYVGILGGTFDPIHFGHLAAAEGALHLTGLDQVLFMPNRQPPHKAGRPVTPAEHRAAMVRLAIADNPRFAFSSLELERAGPSYTLLTVQAMLEQHPGWRLAFLAGMDSLVEITTWYQFQTLLGLIDMIIFTRPGYSAADRDAALGRLGPDLSARIRLLEIPGVAVAGTDLRRRAADGYPLRYLVPDAVETYIREHGLYRNYANAKDV